MQNIGENIAHWAAKMADSLVKAERCAANGDDHGQSFHMSEARLAASQLEEGGIPIVERVKKVNLGFDE